jgi:hypothetical protein
MGRHCIASMFGPVYSFENFKDTHKLNIKKLVPVSQDKKCSLFISKGLPLQLTDRRKPIIN